MDAPWPFVLLLTMTAVSGCIGHSDEDLADAYQRGVADGRAQRDDEVQSAYDRGFSDGYAQGKQEGEEKYSRTYGAMPQEDEGAYDCDAQAEVGDSFDPVLEAYGVVEKEVVAGENVTLWALIHDCSDIANFSGSVYRDGDGDLLSHYGNDKDCRGDSNPCPSGNLTFSIQIPANTPLGWYYLGRFDIHDAVGNYLNWDSYYEEDLRIYFEVVRG